MKAFKFGGAHFSRPQLEGIYTLCYSKPEFEAIGWWDFADYGGHFWPHGGLLRKDFSPKESYSRLLKLQKDWGVASARNSRAFKICWGGDWPRAIAVKEPSLLHQITCERFRRGGKEARISVSLK